MRKQPRFCMAETYFDSKSSYALISLMSYVSSTFSDLPPGQRFAKSVTLYMALSTPIELAQDTKIMDRGAELGTTWLHTSTLEFTSETSLILSCTISPNSRQSATHIYQCHETYASLGSRYSLNAKACSGSVSTTFNMLIYPPLSVSTATASSTFMMLPLSISLDLEMRLGQGRCRRLLANQRSLFRILSRKSQYGFQENVKLSLVTMVKWRPDLLA